MFACEKRYRRVCVWGKDGCKRKRMGVDVWAAVGVGRWQEVSSGSFVPKHRKQTQPQGPSRSRRLPVSTGGGPPRPESVSSRPPPANDPGSVLCYPHSYTKGSVWKVGPRPKHETDRHSRGRKEVGRSRRRGGGRTIKAPPHRANKPERRELERKVKTRLNSPSSTTSSNEPDGLQKTPFLVFIPL